MKKIYNKLCLLFTLCVAQQTWAQADVTAAGAEGTGPGGTVSYSVGQVAYTQYTGTGGRVHQGVQQAYLITELSTENAPETSIHCEVFPNPTLAGVKFVLHGITSFNGMAATVLDATGKVLVSHTSLSAENEIPMTHLPAGTYVLRLTSPHGLLRSFKIIKY